MPDLHEELGRLADEVGEPVTFRQLEVTRRRRERRRRSGALVVGIAVLAAAALFLATTFRDQPQLTPEVHSSPSTPPLGSGATSIADLCDARLGQPLTVVEEAAGPGVLSLKGCPFWPANKSFTLSFETVPPMAAGLMLYLPSDCASWPCAGDPVWSGRLGFSARLYRVPQLDRGRYVLVDPAHRARMGIIVKDLLPPPTCNMLQPHVVETATRLVGCEGWAADSPLTLSFRNESPGKAVALALYPAVGCGNHGCYHAPVWHAKVTVGPAERTYQLPKLRAGRYVLLDRNHAGVAYLLIFAG